jgi:hypothetical protein
MKDNKIMITTRLKPELLKKIEKYIKKNYPTIRDRTHLIETAVGIFVGDK